MISTWSCLMAEYCKRWDPACCSSEFLTSEKFALILSGRSLDSIPYQKPWEKGPLTGPLKIIKAYVRVHMRLTHSGQWICPEQSFCFVCIGCISLTSKFRGVGESARLRLSGRALPRAGCVALGLVEETSPALVSTALLGEGRPWFLGGRSF